jgi:FkbM family methyltransferase
MASFGRDVCALKSITGIMVLVLMLGLVTLWLDMRNGSTAGIARIQATLLDIGFDNQTAIPSLAPSVKGADTARTNGVCQHLLSTPFTPGAKVGKHAAGSPAAPGGESMPLTSPCYGYEHLENLTKPGVREAHARVSASELEAARKGCSGAGLKPCTFYSQMHEDAVLFNMFFKNLHNGVYLELGALDGITYSNTLFFQQSMNWTGILIEPGTRFADLKINRGGGHNVLHNRAVCREGGLHEFKFVQGAEAEGGLDTPRRTWGKRVRSHTVECERLGSILKRSGLKDVKHIDFFSLDVEGRELEVLQSMDWDTPFNVLIMEDNKDHDKIATLLVSKGYEYIRRQRGNVIWALRSFRPKI